MIILFFHTGEYNIPPRRRKTFSHTGAGKANTYPHARSYRYNLCTRLEKAYIVCVRNKKRFTRTRIMLYI